MFEVDAIGLLNVAAHLNQGLDIAGQALGATTRFHVGVAVNPFPDDPEREWRRLGQKIEAGAEFLMTPPVLDIEGFEPVLDRLRATGLPVLVGVATLENARHAELLSSEVVGVRAPEALLDRLRRASDPHAEANAATAEIIEWLRRRADGVVLTWLHGSAATAERWVTELASRTRTSSVRNGATV